jgi:hypothetical protein
MYSSGQYRWFTPDPLQADIFNPQSMSRYSYAGGNGTNLTDPTGLFAYCPYGETDNQCNPPPDSQYYMNLSYYEWSCMLNNCMLYGGQPTMSGGGGAPAPPILPGRPSPRPIKPPTYTSCLTSAVGQTVSQNTAQLELDLEKSAAYGVALGVGGCGLIVAFEPYLGPAFVPCAGAVSLNVVAVASAASVDKYLLGNIFAVGGSAYYCAVDTW